MRFHQILHAWACSHEFTPRRVAIFGAGWLTGIGLALMSLPVKWLHLINPDSGLKNFGVVAIAVLSVPPALWLADTLQWMTAVSAQPISRFRLVWFLAMVCLYTAPLLAYAGILANLMNGSLLFIQAGALFVGASMLARVLIGATATIFAAFTLTVVATSGLLPWTVNVIFNDDLYMLRACLAGAFLLAALSLYTARGLRYD